jgi:hypothetical protein
LLVPRASRLAQLRLLELLEQQYKIQFTISKATRAGAGRPSVRRSSFGVGGVAVKSGADVATAPTGFESVVATLRMLGATAGLGRSAAIISSTSRLLLSARTPGVFESSTAVKSPAESKRVKPNRHFSAPRSKI